MTPDALWAEYYIRLKRCRDGALIYNINDQFIGRALDKYGEFSRGELIFLRQLIEPGMTVVDVGANIGVLTVPFARLVRPGGKVIAFEPQRIVYQMLCGNIALNALDNVFAHNAAAGSAPGAIAVPAVDYAQPGNFGGISVATPTAGEPTGLITLDSLGLERCDLIKIDVEGMELEALDGAAKTIERSHPIMLIEKIKADATQLRQWLETRGYVVIEAGINLLVIHSSDASLAEVLRAIQPAAQPAA
jgi:FkbM family methyltransferase